MGLREILGIKRINRCVHRGGMCGILNKKNGEIHKMGGGFASEKIFTITKWWGLTFGK